MINKTILAISISLIVAILGGVFLAYLKPSLRYNALRAASELAGIVTYFSIRAPILRRDFERVGVILNRHLDWARYYPVKQSTLLPSLMKHTQYAMKAVHFKNEYTAMAPYLRGLSGSYPELFLPKVWLAKSLVATAPSEALPILEQARQLIPVDERPYRLAVEAADRLGDDNLSELWCARYEKAQMGGIHHFEYNTPFFGVGMRKLMLEGDDIGGETFLIENQGIILNEWRLYSFALPKRLSFASFRLLFGTVPSVTVELGKIVVYTPKGIAEQKDGDWATSVQNGYAVQPARFILTGQDGDALTFRHRGGRVSVDRIDIRMRFSRTPFSSICRLERSGG